MFRECPRATCLKQAKECTFSNKVFQRAKGLELPELKRAKYAEPFGLPEVKRRPTEYINHLENRVHYLESLLTNTSTDTFKTPLSNEPESEFVTETLFVPVQNGDFLDGIKIYLLLNYADQCILIYLKN